MAGLGTPLFSGSPEPHEHPDNGLRRGPGSDLLPRFGDEDYSEYLYDFMQALTGVGTLYEVHVPPERDVLVNVIAWYDEDENATHANVSVWPCLN